MLNPEKGSLCLPDPAGRLQPGGELSRGRNSPAIRRCSRANGAAFPDGDLHTIDGTAAVTSPVRLGRDFSGNAEEIISLRARRGHGDLVRSRSPPGPVPPGGHRPPDDPLGRRLHGARNLKRRRICWPLKKNVSVRRLSPLAHPECPANIREHSDFVGGTGGMLRFVGGPAEAATGLPGGHRSEHDVADAEQVPASSLSSGPRHHVRLQQVPAHGPQHARKTARLPRLRPTGDHLATRTSTEMREVLERSLLNTKPAPKPVAAQVDGD